MSGEIYGTVIVLENTTGAIVGQGDFTHTLGGTPVDISNKSYGDYVTYMDGQLADKQSVFAGTLTYNDDAQFRKVRADALSGTQDTYTMVYVGSGVTTDEAFVASYVPMGMSDAISKGVKVETSITFSSSGPVTHTPAVT